MTALRLIGYWGNEQHPELPDPVHLVDPLWDDDERHATSMYFAVGTIARTSMGFSPCRICGIDNGDTEYTDGTYLWPSGLVHYIDEHQVRLPASLVTHATERLDAIEAMDQEVDWWLANTSA